MGKPILIVALVLLMLQASGPVYGSYLEDDPNAGERAVRPIPPPPPRGNEITRLVDRLTVGHPYTTRNLTVFPLYVRGGTDPTSYVTLDEALANRFLAVYEKGEGRVQEVIVRNDSRHYVFLMAGEIISGAKQNRVIATDTLLRPHGPEIAVPVYCVERGRWAGRSTAFSSEKSFANNALRYKAQSKAGQNVVWEEVNRVAGEAGVNSPTSNFQDVVNDKEVRKALGEYAKCMPRPPRRCIGAAIVINNGSSEGTAYATQASHGIAGVEVFANEALFAALWPKLRRGYALDAYPLYGTWHRMRVGNLVSERRIRAFLNRVHNARFTVRNGIDLGRLYAIRGNAITGEGLVFDAAESRARTVVHVNFAPRRRILVPRRDPIILEEREDASTTENTEDTE